jgi:hypothetical protein
MHYLHLLMLPAAAALLVLFVRRFPWLGWLVLWFLVVSAYDYSGLTQLANFGGIAIYPADVAALVLLSAIATTPGAFRSLAPVDLWNWVPLLLIALLSLERGVSAFGLGVAANEARGMVQLIALTMWVWGRMRLPGFETSLRRWILLTGAGLSLDALYHVSQRGIGQVDQLILVNGQLVTTRPLVAGQALVLGLLGLALIVRERHRWARLLGLAFLGLAILCQHRSVWVALAAALVMLVLASPRVRGRILAFGFVGGVALLVAYSAGGLDPFLAKFSLAYHSRGTLNDRLLAARTLVAQQNALGPFTMLFGQPFGSGYLHRTATGTVETFAPHNYYVLLYLRLGVLGAGLWVVGLLRGLRTSLMTRDARGTALSVALITYSLAYNLSIYLAPLLALALTARAVTTGEHEQPIAKPGRHAWVPAASA